MNETKKRAQPWVRIIFVPKVTLDEAEQRRGYVLIKDAGPVQVLSIESDTPAAIQIEMRTLLSRYIGRNVEITVYRCKSEVSQLGVNAVTPLAACRVIDLDCEWVRAHRSDGLKFCGARTRRFKPLWYVAPEPPILISGIDLDRFNCPQPVDLPRPPRPPRDRRKVRTIAPEEFNDTEEETIK